MKQDIPHSNEAEMGCLGSILVDPTCISQIVQEISENYFHIPAHRIIYRELVALWETQEKFDLLTFTQHLRDKKILENIGGAAAVTAIYTFVPSSANLPYYSEILRDKFLLRGIIATCEAAHLSAYQQQDNIPKLVAEIQDKFLSLTNANSKKQPTIRELAYAALQEIEDARAKGKVPGLETGLPDLDRQIGGMRPGQLVIIAGETSQGKTALALNIAEHNAIANKIPVGIVSLEMSGNELAQRIEGSFSRVNIHNFVSGYGKEKDAMKLIEATAKLADAPLYLHEDSDIDSTQLRGIARQMRHGHKIELLIVDYVQLLTPKATKDENRERAMASIAHALKQSAKELDIVVVALSQVNDEGKLRESRAIGHHADKVMTIEHGEENEPSTIRVNKNRSGPTGAVSVTFLREYVRFESLSHRKDEI